VSQQFRMVKTRNPLFSVTAYVFRQRNTMPSGADSYLISRHSAIDLDSESNAAQPTETKNTLAQVAASGASDALGEGNTANNKHQTQSVKPRKQLT
jgi:hypothetical protein